MNKELSSTSYPVGAEIDFDGMILTKLSDAVIDPGNPGLSTVEIWEDKNNNDWTPTLAFINGEAIGFVPVK